MTRPRSFIAAASRVAATVALLSLAPANVSADVPKDQCVDSNARAQSLRRQGKFAESRAQLRICADPTCPALVRDDCTQRLNELDGAQPTIVLDVKDADGGDVLSVRVSIDGQVVAEELRGTALPVDPGEHAFSFEVAERPPVARRFVLKEGEKERRERIVLAAKVPTPDVAGARSPASPAQAEATATSSAGLGARRWLGIGSMSLGVAGVATGAVLGIAAAAALGDQRRDCASAVDCSNHALAVSDHSRMQTDGTWSTIAFAAGGALLVTGAVLFLGGGGDSPARAGALVLAPSLGPGQTSLLLHGAF
jgi:hypothetical protein